jgi:hypothetical protein
MSRVAERGTVECGVVYTRRELMRRLDIGERAWRDLLRRGLQVRRLGRRVYVVGDDVLRLLTDQQ